MKRQKAKVVIGAIVDSPFGACNPFHKSSYLLALLLVCLPVPAAAQFGTSTGFVIQLIGMVQVEPGPNVITLEVKDTEIRFQMQDLESTFKDFSAQRFLSDIRHRSPSLYIRGPEHLLDLLLKEKPRKRVLKLSGLYHADSRRLLLTNISPVQELQKPQF
ncbi:MAG: hypothetical protein AB7P69_05890 [Candidatus Binatia bacterium]